VTVGLADTDANCTVACPMPGLADTPRGAEGGKGIVIILVLREGGDGKNELLATIWKKYVFPPIRFEKL